MFAIQSPSERRRKGSSRRRERTSLFPLPGDVRGDSEANVIYPKENEQGVRRIAKSYRLAALTALPTSGAWLYTLHIIDRTTSLVKRASFIFSLVTALY